MDEFRVLLWIGYGVFEMVNLNASMRLECKIDLYHAVILDRRPHLDIDIF